MVKLPNNGNNLRHKILGRVLCLLGISILFSSMLIAQKPVAKKNNVPPVNKQAPILKPQVPTANRNNPKEVFLEHADRLSMDDNISTEYQVLSGNVHFRKQGMNMYCDSAHFYDLTNSLHAFGNVKMQQGDTLFAFADILVYDGMKEIANLKGEDGKGVELINRKVHLTSDSVRYDLKRNVGYYDTGGTIEDDENRLESVYGEYNANTKEAYFENSVSLFNPKFTMATEKLRYNTTTHIANVVTETEIVAKEDGSRILTSSGWYNTSLESSELYNRSTVCNKDGVTITADTLFYDRRADYGEAYGKMILFNPKDHCQLEGDYGYHDQRHGESFVTGHARAMEFSRPDTIYLHADSIRAYKDEVDSTRVMQGYHRVRFFRRDVQGVCDSLSFTERDSILHMHRHPIVWSEDKQVSGNVILVHLNDTTVDWAKLPEYGFLCQEVGEGFYNQLSGKEMLAEFEDGEIRRLDVNGNVQVIMLPMENDSTYNKLVNAESSFLKADFYRRNVEKIILWPETTGSAIPLFGVRKGDKYLPDFIWEEEVRPKNPDDIMDGGEAMDALMNKPEKATTARRTDGAVASSTKSSDGTKTSKSTDEIKAIKEEVKQAKKKGNKN